jgi:hypothetical protein
MTEYIKVGGHVYACDVCLKGFKTNQHLNQHKNKKKKCKPCTSGNSNNISESSSYSESVNNNFPNISQQNSKISELVDILNLYNGALIEKQYVEQQLKQLQIQMKCLINENMIIKKNFKNAIKMVSTIQKNIDYFNESLVGNIIIEDDSNPDTSTISNMEQNSTIFSPNDQFYYKKQPYNNNGVQINH